MSLEDAHLLLEDKDHHLVQEWDQQVEHEEECLPAVSLAINFKIPYLYGWVKPETRKESGLKIATNTVANATNISSLATKFLG